MRLQWWRRSWSRQSQMDCRRVPNGICPPECVVVIAPQLHTARRLWIGLSSRASNTRVSGPLCLAVVCSVSGGCVPLLRFLCSCLGVRLAGTSASHFVVRGLAYLKTPFSSGVTRVKSSFSPPTMIGCSWGGTTRPAELVDLSQMPNVALHPLPSSSGTLLIPRSVARFVHRAPRLLLPLGALRFCPCSCRPRPGLRVYTSFMRLIEYLIALLYTVALSLGLRRARGLHRR